MVGRVAVGLLVALSLAGCDSGGKSDADAEHAESPAARLVRHFYEAANDADGRGACSLLTDAGIGAVVRVGTRTECVATIDGLERGSFATDEDELVEIEGVDETADGFDVDAVVKGKTDGTYSVVRRGGRLLIDGFRSKEG